MQRLLKGFIFLGVLLFFFMTVAGVFLLILTGGDPISFTRETYLRWSINNRQEDLERSAGIDPREQIFSIEAGDSPIRISNRLLEEGLIVDAQLFVDYMIVENLDTQVQQGTYFLSEVMTIKDIASTITNRANTAIVFVIQPGMRIEEVISLVANESRFQFPADEFAALIQSGASIDAERQQAWGIPIGASLEGFLFPDTYILSPRITAQGLRTAILDNFAAQVPAQIAADAALASLSVRDIITIASIVEREALWDDEKPMIAGVYRNRLSIGMKLDADPTVQYALQGTRGSWWPPITLADYSAVQSPYNTYLNQGLPPGPISNPSLAAIEAATYPAESEYLFFRVKCDGSSYHNFALTFDEHLANGC